MESVIKTIVLGVLKIIMLPFYVGQLVFIITSKFIKENDNQAKMYDEKIHIIRAVDNYIDLIEALKEIPYLLYLVLIYIVKELVLNNSFLKVDPNLLRTISSINFLFCIFIVLNIFRCIYIFNNKEYIYTKNGFIIRKITTSQYIISLLILMIYNIFVYDFLFDCYKQRFENYNLSLFIAILMYIFFKSFVTLPIAKLDEKYYKLNIENKSKFSLNIYYFVMAILSVLIIIIIMRYIDLVHFNISKFDYILVVFVGIILLVLGGMRDEFVSTTRKFTCKNNKLYYKSIDEKIKLIGNINDDSDDISKCAKINCKSIK